MQNITLTNNITQSQLLKDHVGTSYKVDDASLYSMPSEVNKPLLLHGDCAELLARIPDASIDAIITDPPYFLGLTRNGKKGCFNDLAIAKPFYKHLFEEYKRVLTPKGCLYFFTDWKGMAFYFPIMDAILEVKNCLVWDKKSGPGSYYSYSHEFILFHAPTTFERKVGLNVIHNILPFATGAKKTNGEKVHPTQKPFELIEKFIKDSTDAGDVILDSFMGSGTTGVACINQGRRFVGMELDEKYFEIARNRISNVI